MDKNVDDRENTANIRIKLLLIKGPRILNSEQCVYSDFHNKLFNLLIFLIFILPNMYHSIYATQYIRILTFKKEKNKIRICLKVPQ